MKADGSWQEEAAIGTCLLYQHQQVVVRQRKHITTCVAESQMSRLHIPYTSRSSEHNYTSDYYALHMTKWPSLCSPVR